MNARLLPHRAGVSMAQVLQTDGPNAMRCSSPQLLGLFILALTGCDHAADRQAAASSSLPVARYPQVIQQPAATGRLRVQTAAGQQAAVGCATCHAAGARPALVSGLDAGAEFHAGVSVEHGRLSCVHCHVEGAPDRLALAGGETLPITNTLEFCSQCHGIIRRSYEHGAHGGMRGYWDRSRGPQYRNTCTSCHSPHRPAYPQVWPVAGPRDRKRSAPRQIPSLIEARFGGGSHE